MIPDLRGPKVNHGEARAVGEMLIQATDEMAERHRIQGKSGDKEGSTEESSAED